MAAAGSILCIGTCSYDLTLRCLKNFPEAGGRAGFGSWIGGPGGNCVNVALAARLIGEDPALLVSVGNDVFGHLVRSELAALGLQMDIRAGREQTSVSIILTDADAERSFLYNVGSNIELTVDDVANAIRQRRPNVVVFAGIALTPGLLGNAFEDVVGSALSDVGAVSIVDPGLQPDWSTAQWQARLAGVLPIASYFTPSWREAVALTGSTHLAEIEAVCRQLGTRGLIVKDGANGCYGWCERSATMVHVPATPVLVEDTTGAGDAWCAGFASGLRAGLALEQCLELGNQAGARCAAKPGNLFASFA